MTIGENLFLLNEKPTYQKICIKKTQKNTNFIVKFITLKFKEKKQPPPKKYICVCVCVYIQGLNLSHCIHFIPI